MFINCKLYKINIGSCALLIVTHLYGTVAAGIINAPVSAPPLFMRAVRNRSETVVTLPQNRNRGHHRAVKFILHTRCVAVIFLGDGGSLRQYTTPLNLGVYATADADADADAGGNA